MGMTRPITKEEFIEKMERLPLFTNLIRVETFYRDRIKENSLTMKKVIKMPVYTTVSISNVLFLFKFKPRYGGYFEEGLDINP